MSAKNRYPCNGLDPRFGNELGPATDSAPRLEQVEKTWEDLCAQMLTIRQIFLYLDRSYVIAASGVRSLFEMGLQLFRTHLAAHPEVTPGPVR